MISINSLSRIEIFIEVARENSFSGAARNLGLTGSAVSKQIQHLEDELKVKLFTRTTRKVSLTEEGAIYFERASFAIDELKEAADEIHELRDTPRGNLKVSIPTSLGTHYLKKPIAEFAKEHPDVTLDVSFDDRMVDITEERFDLVLRIGALQDSSLVARRLAPAPIQAFCSSQYIEQYGQPSTPEDLSAHNVVAYTRNKGAQEWRYQGPDGKEGVVALTSTFKTDFAEMMIEAACQKIGIIICPAIFVKKELNSGELVQILPDYRSYPERNLYAVFPTRQYISTRLRLFIDKIKAFCDDNF
ncbi:LysR family transcriptional regulator [Kangiella spongicola]|uniref:LysR family transcriptional regulator n=1 Tax=Kangiella spongicola TaxID=796379 RepID=A0A318D4J3_9GAMM|nr:LysR family transcriptional regulator [Kangiella spongicola]PXF62768.1 LysR family transcriptional regulator [Kangiella spongicola]